MHTQPFVSYSFQASKYSWENGGLDWVLAPRIPNKVCMPAWLMEECRVTPRNLYYILK